MDFLTFQEDKKSQYAVIRALEIIGEASKKIPKKLKRIIHGFHGDLWLV